MSQRRASVLVSAAVGVGIVLALTGCFPKSSTPTSSPSAATQPAVSPTPSEASTPTPSPSATTPPAATGCSPTSAQTPSGAVTRKTIDVDGDGRADTEWLSESPSLEFGVTTASGASYAFPAPTASGAPREGFIARLNDHRILAMVDDNRSVSLYFFVNCAWVETKRSNGTEYPLDFNDFSGTGSGVGCSLGYVESYQSTNTATGYTVTETPVDLNGTGSIGTPGATASVVANASSSDPRVKVAQELSCGSVTVASGGVTLN